MAWEQSTRAARLPGNWNSLRQFVLERDPVCRTCRKVASAEVDHIVPGDNHDPGNLSGICHDCHVRKTRQEAMAKRRLRRRPTEIHPGVRCQGRNGNGR